MLKAQVIGHIGQDAVIEHVNGQSVIKFSVAHSEKGPADQSGNRQSKTTWVNCSWWTEKTKILPFLVKGSQIYVEGLPSINAYQDKQGAFQASFRLSVISVQLLASKQNSQQPQEQNSEPVDDLPF